MIASSLEAIAEATMPRAGAEARILVLESDAGERDSLLQRLGARWEATAVGDCPAALDAMNRQRLDLLLVDEATSGLEGRDSLRELRAEAAKRSIGVLALCDGPREAFRDEALEAGVDCLVKPFSEADVSERVRDRCVLEKALAENEQQREALRTARLEAEAANRAKDEFLAMLGHELRNPLSPILTALQLMRLRGTQSRERVRILVVDDNDDAAATLAFALEQLGYVAETAFDGPSALEKAQGFRPDVALLDIGLPVMDGYELAVRLRELGGAPQRPRLIAITGYGQEADRQRSAAAGFEKHLVKPVDLTELESVLRNTGS